MGGRRASEASRFEVKKIKITVRQYAEICLFSTAQYKCPVAELEAEDGFPLGPSTQMSKVRRG